MPDDGLFLVLAHPVRRRLLQILAEGRRAAGDLAGQFDLNRPAVAEHLSVLRRAALVRNEPVGRQRRYHLTAEPLAEVEDWLHPFEHFWRARLRSLADVAEEETSGARRVPRGTAGPAQRPPGTAPGRGVGR